MICVTPSRGIIFISCFLTCFRCVEKFGSSGRIKMLGKNNVSNYSLSLFSDLDFVFSSSVAPNQACWTLPHHALPPPCFPPHSCCPPTKQGQLPAGLDSHKWFVGGGRLGRVGRLGEQSSFHKQNWGLNFSQRPPCQGDDGPGGTSCFFLFLILNSTSQD